MNTKDYYYANSKQSANIFDKKTYDRNVKQLLINELMNELMNRFEMSLRYMSSRVKPHVRNGWPLLCFGFD